MPRGGFGSTPSLKALGFKSFNDKLNVAAIGVGGQGGADLNDAAKTENIVALCDVDFNRGAANLKKFEKPPKYKDFRVMLDKEKNIDAVTIGIPDFMHATVALACMQRGKHVYCEKPLTRTPWEARLLMTAAAKYKVATQMGNQGFSHECNRVAAEIVWSGAIGDVKEAHFSTTPGTHPTGLQQLPPEEPVPAQLDQGDVAEAARWHQGQRRVQAQTTRRHVGVTKPPRACRVYCKKPLSKNAGIAGAIEAQQTCLASVWYRVLSRIMEIVL